MRETFPITVTAQMRHGVLWEARAVAGNSAKLARLLELPTTTIGHWINFKHYPSKKWWDTHGIKVEGRLTALLSRPVTYDDLFPAEIRTQAFEHITKKQEVTHEVPLEQLTGLDARLSLPPAQTDIDLKEAISVALAKLKPRERRILEMRFGLNGEPEMPLAEVGKELGVTPERVRQLEARALRRLRHPANNKPLKVNGAVISR